MHLLVYEQQGLTDILYNAYNPLDLLANAFCIDAYQKLVLMYRGNKKKPGKFRHNATLQIL